MPPTNAVPSQQASFNFDEVVAMFLLHASLKGDSVHFDMTRMSDVTADLVGQLRVERKWDLVVREIKRRLQAAG